MRTHLPMTVSTSNPCPDSGCSNTSSASWSERSSNTARTRASRLPTYRPMSATWTSAAAAISRSDTASTPRRAKSEAAASSTARRTSSGPEGDPAGRLGPGRPGPAPSGDVMLPMSGRTAASDLPRGHHGNRRGAYNMRRHTVQFPPRHRNPGPRVRCRRSRCRADRQTESASSGVLPASKDAVLANTATGGPPGDKVSSIRRGGARWQSSRRSHTSR